jgi:hypothetical protein
MGFNSRTVLAAAVGLAGLAAVYAVPVNRIGDPDGTPDDTLLEEGEVVSTYGKKA